MQPVTPPDVVALVIAAFALPLAPAAAALFPFAGLVGLAVVFGL